MWLSFQRRTKMPELNSEQRYLDIISALEFIKETFLNGQHKIAHYDFCKDKITVTCQNCNFMASFYPFQYAIMPMFRPMVTRCGDKLTPIPTRPLHIDKRPLNPNTIARIKRLDETKIVSLDKVLEQFCEEIGYSPKDQYSDTKKMMIVANEIRPRLIKYLDQQNQSP